MKNMTIFDHNAKLLRGLKEDIDTSFAQRELDDARRLSWAEACHRFQDSFDKLAFPGGLDREMRMLRKEDPEAVEMAVRFLEADPWFFRSGYIKEELLDRLRQVALTDDQQERLRSVILEQIESGGGREFRRYCHLARLLDAPAFREVVLKLAGSQDSRVARRARWVLTALIPTALSNQLLQESAG
jgi:hypothetical protein